MPARKDVEQLSVQKQALVLESSLNRHELLAEIAALRSATMRVSNAVQASQRFVPLLAILAPVAGFFAFRSARRPVSMITRVVKLAKWAGPAYSLWRNFSAARSQRP